MEEDWFIETISSKPHYSFFLSLATALVIIARVNQDMKQDTEASREVWSDSFAVLLQHTD